MDDGRRPTCQVFLLLPLLLWLLLPLLLSLSLPPLRLPADLLGDLSLELPAFLSVDLSLLPLDCWLSPCDLLVGMIVSLGWVQSPLWADKCNANRVPMRAFGTPLHCRSIDWR